MMYGYARVSTNGQAKEGNSLQAQEEQLRAAGAQEIFADAYTGTKIHRPQFEELIKKLEPGDTLIVTKLDRFARSVSQATDLITDLIDKGISINILNIGTLNNTPSGKLIKNIFLSFAEFERDMIVQRTQEGKEIAKQDPDFREGRPKKYSEKKIKEALTLLETKSYKQVSEITGISVPTLVRAKRNQ